MMIDNGARINGSAYATDSAAVRTDFRPKQVDTQTGGPEQTGVQKPKVQSQVTIPGRQGVQPGQQEPKLPDENDSRKLKNAVEHANQTMRHSKTKCEFSYHEETKRVSIKVIDEEPDEVIREIPPEETLEMLSKMWELAGLMVDEKR